MIWWTWKEFEKNETQSRILKEEFLRSSLSWRLFLTLWLQKLLHLIGCVWVIWWTTHYSKTRRQLVQCKLQQYFPENVSPFSLRVLFYISHMWLFCLLWSCHFLVLVKCHRVLKMVPILCHFFISFFLSNDSSVYFLFWQYSFSVINCFSWAGVDGSLIGWESSFRRWVQTHIVHYTIDMKVSAKHKTTAANCLILCS